MTKTEDRKKYAAGHYYLVPNAVFVLGLSPGELAVYNYLRFKEDRATYECIASYREIGKAIHAAKNSVAKYVRGLEDKELISTEHTTIHRRSDGAARNGCLRYRLHHIDHAVRAYYQRQLIAADNAAALERLRQRREEPGENAEN